RPHHGQERDHGPRARALQRQLRRRRHQRRRPGPPSTGHAAGATAGAVLDAGARRLHLLVVDATGRRRPRNVRLPRGAGGAAAGTVWRVAARTSATRQAIDSSAARAMWADREPEVCPATTALASDFHQGAPTPASAGRTRTPPASSTSAAIAARAGGSAASP